MSTKRKKLLTLSLGLALFAGVMLAIVTAVRRAYVEQQVYMATGSTNLLAVVSAEGTNTILRLDKRAIPVLLRWSRGCDPNWYKWANAGRKLLKKPPLESNWFWPSENARRGFLVLRDRAASAVPSLVEQLRSTNRDARRISVHMLAAIGPPVTSQAFRQMTNCLTDPDREVRNDVVWAIQFQHPEDYPVETLLTVYGAGLKDTYHVARENAQAGLRKLADGPIPSEEIIELVRRDSSPDISRVADRWLERSRENVSQTHRDQRPER